MTYFRIFITFSIVISTQFFLLAQKNMGMKGSPNFRELGGITTTDGLKIKQGQLYRSGTISRLSDEDMSIFSNTSIKYIIDLRSEMEIARDPDTFPQNLGIIRIHAPIGAIDSVWMMKWMLAIQTAGENPDIIEHMMIDANKNFIQNIQDYKPMFDLLKKGQPILWHCSAGKDRTGLASALILHILGVDKEMIFQDFMESNNNISNDSSMAAKYGLSTDTWKMLQGVKVSYLNASLSAIDLNYGNIDQMLKQEFNIDENEQLKIRSFYLEN
jgi:protein-tyrosine phosphatase